MTDYRDNIDGKGVVFGTNGPIGRTDSPTFHRPGVVIGRKGAYRGVHYSDGPFSVIDTAFALQVDSSVDIRWAYHSLKLADINGMDSGSAIPSTTRESFYELRVRLPRIEEQRAIAEVLSALDDKIATNTGAKAKAEKLASSMFHRAAGNGAHLPLSSLASFVNGGAYTKGASGKGRVVVRIAELNGGIGGSTVFSDATVPDDQTARFGDLLFAWSGSLTVHRWYRDDAIINQHIFKVLPKNTHPVWLVHQALLSALPSLKATAADKATTMGHIKREHLDIAVPVPGAQEMEQIRPLLEGAWNLALATERENLRLIDLRDTLLPALMSGKLRVKDAERAVEDVL